MALTTRSSSRLRNAPQIYTPNRDQITNSSNVNYNLNSKRALQKKVTASERYYDCDIQFKSGTLVITCSAAAYEMLKNLYMIIITACRIKKITISTIKSKLDNMEINSDSVIIEGAVSVKNKQGRCNR